MRIRCKKLRRGARVRLVFRSPYVRVFRLHNGTGTINIRLDKFPGTAVPLGQLTTRLRATYCTAVPTGRHVGTHQFKASARVTCRGVSRNAQGVPAVGGLLAPSPSPPTRSPTGTRGSRRLSPVAARVPSRHWATRFRGSTATRPESRSKPWQSTIVGIYPPNPPCPSAWPTPGQISPRALGQILNFLYPPAIYVEPTDSWWWSDVFGVVTNWEFTHSITVMWQ